MTSPLWQVVLVGGVCLLFGVFVMCLAAVAGRADDASDRMERRWSESAQVPLAPGVTDAEQVA